MTSDADADSPKLLYAISDTGPLISALQSNSLEVLVGLFGTVYTAPACVSELERHGWQDILAGASALVTAISLAPAETEQARHCAKLIAAHPLSKEREPSHHLGEAEVIVLASRPAWHNSIALLDELAARAVAVELGVNITGFAGVLLVAVQEGLLTAENLRQRLTVCRDKGTHYSASFIERIVYAAQEAEHAKPGT